MIKRFFKFIVKLWRKIFRKKLKVIRPSGSSSILAQSTNGIEPLFNPTYKRSIR